MSVWTGDIGATTKVWTVEGDLEPLSKGYSEWADALHMAIARYTRWRRSQA